MIRVTRRLPGPEGSGVLTLTRGDSDAAGPAQGPEGREGEFSVFKKVVMAVSGIFWCCS